MYHNVCLSKLMYVLHCFFLYELQKEEGGGEREKTLPQYPFTQTLFGIIHVTKSVLCLFLQPDITLLGSLKCYLA